MHQDINYHLLLCLAAPAQESLMTLKWKAAGSPHLHLGQRREPRSTEIQLLLQRLGWEGAAPGKGRGEADVEDALCPAVRLNVEDEDILGGHRQHGGHTFQELAQQGGQEAVLGHIL